MLEGLHVLHDDGVNGQRFLAQNALVRVAGRVVQLHQILNAHNWLFAATVQAFGHPCESVSAYSGRATKTVGH